MAADDPTQLPVICDNCGLIFPSGFAFGNVTNLTMLGNKSQCPRCGAWASLPEGVFDFIDGSLRVVSQWSPEKRRQFADALHAAQRARDPIVATAAVIDAEPELQKPPFSNARGMLLIALATLLLGCLNAVHEWTSEPPHSPPPTINIDETVIQQIYDHEQPDPPLDLRP